MDGVSARKEVVAAIIRKGGRIFATQRGYGEFKDWWEFPGGKMEPGETPEEALVREVREELDAEISIDKLLYTVEWDYPKFHLTMHCFMTSLLNETLNLKEHEAARWLTKDEIHSVNWLPADEILLPMIATELENNMENRENNMSYPQIDLSEWRQVGEGGNGKTYENPERPDLILKVNNARLSTFEAVKHEFEVSKAVEGLGLSVPKMYEIVRVGEAYATISQRIKDKKSLSRICHDEPERTEEMGRLLCEKGKEFFAVPCDTSFFPSRKAQVLQALEKATFVSRKNRKLIRAFAESVPENTHCVHGDFQTGNIIKSGDDYYWIDLDRFAYGDPMFDIGHLYQICRIYAPMKRVQEIFHMTENQFQRLWDAFAKSYTGKDDHSDFDRLAGKFACLDVIVRTYFMAPTFLEKLFFSFTVRRLVKYFFK